MAAPPSTSEPAPSSDSPSSSTAPAPTQTTSEPVAEEEEEASQCPLCAFIEAGECREQHKAWSACREVAKKEGKDYVDECHDQFKVFLQCTFDNSDYYAPFLSTLLGEEEGEEEAEQGGKETAANNK